MDNPTEKQIDFIREIEEMTGVEFLGNTKSEASVYISRHIKGIEAMREAIMESRHGDWGWRD